MIKYIPKNTLIKNVKEELTMYEVVVLLAMLFCHIVDDYYLQGFLASAKQKSYWEKNNPEPLYKHDYIIALIEHAFSWTCMVHLPVFIIYIGLGMKFGANFFVWFFVHMVLHALTDHLKANVKMINLCTDQIIHVCQVISIWLPWIVFM